MLKRLASATVLTMAVGGVLMSATPALAGGGGGLDIDPDKYFNKDIDTYNIQICTKDREDDLDIGDDLEFEPTDQLTTVKDENNCAQTDPDGVENTNDSDGHKKNDHDGFSH